MSKPYFRQVPNFEYVSRNKDQQYISDYIPVKNLFKRGKLREDIFGNLSFFEKYSIIGDERPDNVAFKSYGDSTLDWVILLSNNILNIQSEWPLTQESFDRVMLEKYGSYETLYSGIHHYETNEILNSLGIRVLSSGIQISPTWKTNGNFLEINNSKIDEIYSINGSNLIKVELVEGIPGLRSGSQITVNNVSEIEYNGKHIIKEIITRGEPNVKEFTFELSSPPNIASPTLADPRKEEVLFEISDNDFIYIRAASGQLVFQLDYEVDTIEVLKNGILLSKSSYIANDGETIRLINECGDDDFLEVRSRQRLIKANSYYYEYWDNGLEYSVQVPASTFIRPVTNYEYEVSLEEKKRNIYVLKPQYLNIIFNNMDDIMTYRVGGSQYVNSTLIRGDNIRLYE